MTSRAGNVATAFDTSDDNFKKLAEFKVGKGPQQITPVGGGFWILNTDDNSLVFFNGDKITKTIDKVGAQVFGFAITKDEKTAYVVSRQTSSLKKVDLTSGTVSDFAAVDNAPSEVVISADEKYAYVTSEARGTVTQVSLPDGKVIAKLKVGSRPVAIAIVK